MHLLYETLPTRLRARKSKARPNLAQHQPLTEPDLGSLSVRKQHYFRQLAEMEVAQFQCKTVEELRTLVLQGF